MKEDVNEELKKQLQGLEGNYFGWKWSLISLGLIIIGVIALALIGPQKAKNTIEIGNFETDSTSINSDK
jgi:hypothetical protein